MEDLYRIITKRCIELEYDDLKSIGKGLLGLYVLDPAIGHLIVLDSHLLQQPRLHRCVLAEEIGHSFYPPRAGVIRFHCKHGNEAVIVAQDERKALRWATDFLMPDDEFCRAVSQGYVTMHELADYFYVEEWFVQAKIDFLKRGWSFNYEAK